MFCTNLSLVRASTILSSARRSLTKKSIAGQTKALGTSEGSETSADEYSTRRIWFCFDYFSLDSIWKFILKKVKNKFYKSIQSRFGFSSPRAFRRWSQNCCSPCVSPRKLIFHVFLLGVQSSCSCSVELSNSSGHLYRIRGALWGSSAARRTEGTSWGSKNRCLGQKIHFFDSWGYPEMHE